MLSNLKSDHQIILVSPLLMLCEIQAYWKTTTTLANYRPFILAVNIYKFLIHATIVETPAFLKTLLFYKN